jgi:PAS domain S-box-containing protein
MDRLLGGVVGSAAYEALTRPTSVPILPGSLGELLLLIPPLVAVLVIAFQRRRWHGCQGLFWLAIALGTVIAALGQSGAAVERLWSDGVGAWPGWRAVLGLFGFVAPLVALLSQPHRGPRVGAVPSTAIDIAGVTILMGLLYAYFVAAPSVGGEPRGLVELSLLTFSLLQQFVVAAVLGFAFFAHRSTPWGATYGRLAGGATVACVALGWGVMASGRGPGGAGPASAAAWVVPFLAYGWAAARAPASPPSAVDECDEPPARPWLLFGILALVLVAAYWLRHLFPASPAVDEFRALSTTITTISVLALFTARLAADVSQIERADRRVRLLARALEETPDAVFILRRDGVLEYANAAFCRALGYRLDELGALAQRQLIAQESHEAFEGLLTDLAARGTARGTLIRRRRDGSTFPVACALVVLDTVVGPEGFIVGVERDLTEELRIRNQIVHAERLSALGQFVAGVAHEINNPLQAIVGCAELLLARQPSGALRDDAETIRTQAERAGQIVRNLLAFARRGSLERTLEDLNELVRRTVRLRQPHLRARQITLELDLAPGLPRIAMSRDEIQQVIANLLLNAEQAVAAQGGGRIEIRTWATEAGVGLEVADDGPGVPAELQDKIWEPFFTTKRVGEGTGLGLAVSLGIARAHGGLIQLVPSEEGRGAQFRLVLPRVPIPEAAPSPDARDRRSASPSPAL